ncbi:hypothetical protein HEP87_55155 [Streptomyces sp. S1D4-11]|nr:hypothetical protein [Streptomyces sp. S1D4-11]QIZ01134.1 hypothetical protein HEP87_55155 [Streptomyces sp. S1D4-11]
MLGMLGDGVGIFEPRLTLRPVGTTRGSNKATRRLAATTGSRPPSSTRAKSGLHDLLGAPRIDGLVSPADMVDFLNPTNPRPINPAC